MIIDSDILIWYMRGNIAASKVIDNCDNINISAITYIELVQGMRNKKELNALKSSLNYWGAKVLYLTEPITAKAMFYVEQYYLSHSLMLADALIAATASYYGLPLVTGNSKHYKQINEIEILPFRAK